MTEREKFNLSNESLSWLNKFKSEKSIPLSEQEVGEFKQHLGYRRTCLEALSAYLSGTWKKEDYEERLKQTNGRYTPDTYFNLDEYSRIAPNGTIGYKYLEYDNDKSMWDGYKTRFYKLEWETHGPNVQTLAKDLNGLEAIIKSAQTDGQSIPENVQSHFDKLKTDHEQEEIAFERGKHWQVYLKLEKKDHGFPPEGFSIEVFLKDGAALSNLDPRDWRMNIPDFGHKGWSVDKVEKVSEDEYRIIIDSGCGDDSGGATYEGEIIVRNNDIVRASINLEESDTDDYHTGKYTLDSE